MRKMIPFVVLLLFFIIEWWVIAANTHGFNGLISLGPREFHIVEVDSNFEIQCNHYCDNSKCYSDPKTVIVRVDRNITWGPFQNTLEFFETASYLESPDDLQIETRRILTKPEIQQIYECVLHFAMNDERLASMNPGEKTITWMRSESIKSLKLIALSLPIPIAAALLSGYIFIFSKKARALTRSRSGNCMHCGYSVAELDSIICPECGKYHSQFITEATA